MTDGKVYAGGQCRVTGQKLEVGGVMSIELVLGEGRLPKSNCWPVVKGLLVKSEAVV